ncbi:MAG: hypothetical protein H6739_37045 [Alphaproteobacteria bacterium]|nr:hypothetical protein [Alphaproteobacteria bacterium]
MRALLPLLTLAACGTMNGARPLTQGQHAVGLTVGGPMVNLGAPIPLPNAVLEGRSGLPALAGRPTDLNYGLNLTAAAFGVVGGHVGASHLLLDQRGARPALSATDRLYVYDNHLDRSDAAESRALWAMDQLELTASWAPKGQLLYLGAAEYLDFRNPRLTLTPFAGAALDFGRPGGFGLQVESRYFAANAAPVNTAVPWISLGRGAVGLTLGASWTSRAREER